MLKGCTELYFLANEIENNKKVACLLTLMGAKSFGLLKNLSAPTKPSEMTYKDIVKVRRFCPKRLIIAERFRFHKRYQHLDETVSDYAAKIKKLTEYCEFGAMLKDALRDRSVCGLHKERAQEDLLTQEDLTFRNVVVKAVEKEIAAKDRVELHEKSNVHQMSRSNSGARPRIPQVSYRDSALESKLCYQYGRNNHSPPEFYFKDELCHKCNKNGHILTMCHPERTKHRFRKTYTNQNVHTVTNKINSDSDSVDVDKLSIATVGINTVDTDYIIWPTPKVEGVFKKIWNWIQALQFLQ